MEAIDGVRVENFSFRYEDKWIFQNISFSLSKGEVIAVIGPSGSGKTTLSYCLTGIIPHRLQGEWRGEIRLGETDISRLSFQEIVRRVNIVMQNYEMQIFGLTVEEDIVFALENLGLDQHEIDARIKWILKEFELERYREYMVSSLSGGFRQRLSIASTIVLEPDFLIMDDPMANLDWKGILKLKKIILMLKKRGKGILITSRRLKGLEDVIDKVIRLGTNHSESNVVKRKIRGSNAGLVQLADDHRKIISMKGVWFRYHDRDVLKNIDLCVDRGEVVALMGANGSGKTTLAKHLNGLLKPTKGIVEILGRNTRKYSVAELSRYVGFVFQNPDRHITRETVWEEAIFGCENHGLSIENAVEALKLLNLFEKKDRPPYKLSMGEKIRLSIASVLAMNPKVIILDEPTTGQDDVTLGMLESIITQLSGKGKTVILITHDTDFAFQVSSRVVVINEGHIVADGEPGEILTNEELINRCGIEPPTALIKQEVAGNHGEL